MKHIEFAVSKGEGTLFEHGTITEVDLVWLVTKYTPAEYTIIIGPSDATEADTVL